MNHPPGIEPLLLIAHPSPDVYGSDLQLLETVEAVLEAGWRVVVILPLSGPLVERLSALGAKVIVDRFPVLRKSLLSPVGLVRLSLEAPFAVARLARRIRRSGASAVYVNTVTIPVWLAAARLAGVPVLAHVHEAEQDQPKIVRAAIAAPLLIADDVIVNSAAARLALVEVIGRLDASITIVHNGVPAPPKSLATLRRRQLGASARIALVGRLSPRKGIDVALDAIAELRRQGRDVHLTVCGSVFPGYEWFEAELRERSGRSDLAGHVTLAGYVNPTWPILEDADVVVVPSRVEPFGNAAVEGLLAGRPVVASRVQGLVEVIIDGRTGVLVEPADAHALASGIAGVLDDPDLALMLATDGAADATERFSQQRYRDHIRAALDRITSDR